MKVFYFIRKFWPSNPPLKGDIKPYSFDDHVEHGIVANNNFGISKVIGLRSITSMYFEREKYPTIVSLIRDQNLEELAKMGSDKLNPDFPEYLEVMQFENQLGLTFIVTVYDSIELWQDPEVIDIFSFTLPTSSPEPHHTQA